MAGFNTDDDEYDFSLLGNRIRMAVKDRSPYNAPAIASIAGVNRQAISNSYTRNILGDDLLLIVAALSKTSFIWLRFNIGSPNDFERNLEPYRDELMAVAKERCEERLHA